MLGLVYKITNTVDGKIYVGQTTKTLTQRWKEHIYDSIGVGSKDRGSYIHAAIKKYGSENFMVEQLNDCLGKDALDAVEVFYIRYLNTVRPNGYNISLGGTGVMHGRKMSEESKQKISRSLTGHAGCTFKHTDEAKERISASLLGNTRSVGRKHSEETKNKMSLSHLGKKYKRKTL